MLSACFSITDILFSLKVLALRFFIVLFIHNSLVVIKVDLAYHVFPPAVFSLMFLLLSLILSKSPRCFWRCFYYHHWWCSSWFVFETFFYPICQLLRWLHVLFLICSFPPIFRNLFFHCFFFFFFFPFHHCSGMLAFM